VEDPELDLPPQINDRIPWSASVEIDRGFEGACWWIPTWWGVRYALWSTTVGERRKGEVYLHLCEKYNESNFCARPSHIVVASASENVKHRHRLRIAAGASAFRSPETRAAAAAKQSAWVRKPWSEEHKRHISERQKGKPQPWHSVTTTCEYCGRELNKNWMKRHRETGVCRPPKPTPTLSTARGRAISEAMKTRATCEDCGREFNLPWLTRHRREGRCSNLD
jgi:hypothetical protein